MDKEERKRCYFCLGYIDDDDEVDMHHKFPKQLMKRYGLIDTNDRQARENKVLVHRSCHVRFNAEVSRSLHLASKAALGSRANRLRKIRPERRYLYGY